VAREVGFGRGEIRVRDNRGDETEERAVAVLRDEVEGAAMNEVGGVGAFLGAGVFAEDDLAGVVPEVMRVIVVAEALAVEAVETIVTLAERVALRAGVAEAPLAEEAADVAGGLVSVAAGSGCWPSGWTSRLPRTGVCPVWSPVRKAERDGAQTVLPL
jgi:hypothetical protein